MSHDAVVVGAGPNGLAAAVELARNGVSVLVREAADTVGGAARTQELTLPGFRHDVGSAVYPMGVGSPFFAGLPLDEHGLEWVHPEIPMAHPLGNGECALLMRSLDETANRLGEDSGVYVRLLEPFVQAWPRFVRSIMGSPMLPPRDPVLMARFGIRAFVSTTSLARRFRTDGARALLAGNAAHTALPLQDAPSAAIALSLMVAGHAVGWPFPKGGAGALTQALASYLESLGGTVETGAPVSDLAELDDARAVLLDITPRQFVSLAGDRLPAPWGGEVTGQAFVLLAQPSVFDSTRAPDGKHTAWAYCQVPNGWTGDATEAIEAQVERYAPGFRDLVLARSARSPAAMQAWNPNLVGGDFNAGALTLKQTFARPVPRGLRHPRVTPGGQCPPWATPPSSAASSKCSEYHSNMRRQWSR